MNILLFGKGGQVGWELQRSLAVLGRVTALDHDSTDHCAAMRTVLAKGRVGETYNVGGWNEKPNIEIVNTVCALLDELRPRADCASYNTQISYVKDRPGHDRRYAIDASKIERELGWKPAETFDTGIRKTVAWYLANADWVRSVQSGAYRDWVAAQYGAVGA